MSCSFDLTFSNETLALNTGTRRPDLPLCLNCTKFGQLILNKITEMIAGRCRIY